LPTYRRVCVVCGRSQVLELPLAERDSSPYPCSECGGQLRKETEAEESARFGRMMAQAEKAMSEGGGGKGGILHVGSGGEFTEITIEGDMPQAAFELAGSDSDAAIRNSELNTRTAIQLRDEPSITVDNVSQRFKPNETGRTSFAKLNLRRRRRRS
jgi:hypothetical protein